MRRAVNRPNRPPPPAPPFDIDTFEPIEPPWQAIREWIPDDDAEPSFDLFDQRSKSGNRSSLPARTATSSSSTAIEAAERTSAEKITAEKVLGTAERTIILANNA